MSLWRIAWNYLWDRRLTTGLTILSVALAVGLISAVLTLRDETRRRFEDEQNAFDVVVGPPGSPLQLVLNAVYYLDNPTGGVPYGVYEKIRRHEDVAYAFPVGLGDTYGDFRIVGTTRELFDYPWTNPFTGEQRFPFKLTKGRLFEKPMEAVVGYRAARARGLDIGDQFVGTHGSIQIPDAMNPHRGHPYTVVGILGPSGTSCDRAIYVNLESVWELHEEDYEDSAAREKAVTAILIDLQSPALQFTFSDWAEKNFNVKAAIPSIQILDLYRKVLEPAVAVLKAIGYTMVAIAAISVLIGLYLSIIQRRRDLAIMRALGASAADIFGTVLIEAFLVTLMGIAAGWLLGKATAYVLGLYVARSYGMAITSFATSREELSFFAAVTFVGLLAGLLPAWQAYRVDVAKDLAAQ